MANGKIVYMSNNDILVINADGTNAINLTNSAGLGAHNDDPVWSPDGTQIVFHNSLSFGNVRAYLIDSACINC